MFLSSLLSPLAFYSICLTHIHSPLTHIHTHTHTPGLPCPGGHFTNLFISPSAANAAFFPCLQFIWLVVVADPSPPPSFPPSLPLLSVLFLLLDCCCCANAPLSAFRATGCALLFDQRRGTCSVSNAKFTHSLRAPGHNVVNLLLLLLLLVLHPAPLTFAYRCPSLSLLPLALYSAALPRLAVTRPHFWVSQCISMLSEHIMPLHVCHKGVAWGTGHGARGGATLVCAREGGAREGGGQQLSKAINMQSSQRQMGQGICC